jgi:hypothetical protein
MSETWHLLGEGGAVIEMTLPLSPHIEKRYLDGAIRRVNPDGSPWREPESAKRSRARATAAQMLESAQGDGSVRDG